MAKRDKRMGMTPDDMEAYKDLNDELPDPFPKHQTMSTRVTLEDEWRTAAADLSLDIAAPFEVVVPSGAQIKAAVLVKQFGATRGMLLVRAYSDVSSGADELMEQGYGYSVMGDPRPGHEYERDSIIEVLRDWGWSGPACEAPRWLPESDDV